MNKPVAHSVDKEVDSIQQRLTDYACGLNYDDLPSDVVHAAKARIIDTLGALIGGFFGEPCYIARNLAARTPNPDGATVIGTRMKTTPEMAAFVNGITARCVEMTDIYTWPGSYGGHPSDVITPILAAAEHAQASGRDFITGVVLAYEVYLRICDIFKNDAGFCNTNFLCLGTAMAAGKLLGLSPAQLLHCIAMAVVPNVILAQVRRGHQSMYKVVASGHAGRAGVFAALLAREGMEGPHLPFEGKAGWCDHVAKDRFSLNTLGGNGTPFKIPDSHIKLRPVQGPAVASVLAAEKVAPLNNIENVKQVTVEVFKHAKRRGATGEVPWNPDSRDTADHSIPYSVAATLIDGTLTLRSFNDAHLWDPKLRALMQKIEVVENDEFTKAFERLPQEQRARITVVTSSGERLIGEGGGDKDDLAAPKSDEQVAEKFRGATEDFLGTKRVNSVLDRLWHLEDLDNVAAIPPDFVLG